MGVLFKNAEAIEVLRKVDTLVVDKTGTLTEGKPRLVVGRRRRPASTRPSCCGSRRGSSAAASIRSRRRSSRAPRSAASQLGDGRRLRVGHRQGRARARSTGARVALGNRALHGRRSAIDAGALAARADDAARATARPSCSSRSTASSPGWSASPIRSRRRTPEAHPRSCTREGMRDRHADRRQPRRRPRRSRASSASTR